MKKRTVDEVKQMINEVWAPESEHSFDKIKSEVTYTGSSGIWMISLSKMYEAPGLSFNKLKQVADFFDTDKISDERWGHGGCSSCDYGSEYGFTLIVGGEDD